MKPWGFLNVLDLPDLLGMMTNYGPMGIHIQKAVENNKNGVC